MSERPSTSSVLWAEWRRGLKDLQNVVLNPWNGTVATHEEQGAIANPTPQLVTRDIRDDQRFQGELDALAARGKDRDEPERGIER